MASSLYTVYSNKTHCKNCNSGTSRPTASLAPRWRACPAVPPATRTARCRAGGPVAWRRCEAPYCDAAAELFAIFLQDLGSGEKMCVFNLQFLDVFWCSGHLKVDISAPWSLRMPLGPAAETPKMPIKTSIIRARKPVTWSGGWETMGTLQTSRHCCSRKEVLFLMLVSN